MISASGRPAGRAAGVLGRRRRKRNESHHAHGEHRHQRQRQISADEGHGQHGARPRCQIGSGDGAQQAAGQHQRHRFLAPRRRRQLGRSKAVELAVGTVVARNQGGRHQQPELARPGGKGGQQRRAQSHHQPDLERALAPEARLRARHQRRGQRAANHVAHHRQRRHPAEGRQLQADQAVDGDEGDVVGQEKALTQRQQQQGAVHAAV